MVPGGRDGGAATAADPVVEFFVFVVKLAAALYAGKGLHAKQFHRHVGTQPDAKIEATNCGEGGRQGPSMRLTRGPIGHRPSSSSRVDHLV